MPETIIIAGGGRNLGKTHLCEALAKLLPNAAVIKMGHHPPKSEKNPHYFSKDTSFGEIVERAGDHELLIIESGSIINDPDLDPGLIIFLPAVDGKDKPGSEKARSRAHLVRGENPDETISESCRARLGLDDKMWRGLTDLVMISIPNR